MNINEIYGLIDRFDSSSMSELNIEMEGVKLGMKKGYGQSVVPNCTKEIITNAFESTNNIVRNNVADTTVNAVSNNETVKPEGGKEIVAPLVGTFYRASAPGEAPFVEVGTQVKKGDVIGIIEAMKLMNEITAKEDGMVTSIEVEDGAMVEYGQTLIVMK